MEKYRLLEKKTTTDKEKEEKKSKTDKAVNKKLKKLFIKILRNEKKCLKNIKEIQLYY